MVKGVHRWILFDSRCPLAPTPTGAAVLPYAMQPRFAVQHPAGAARAVILVVHGLNLRPERMQPICELLLERQAIVVRMALRGHRGLYERLESVRRRDWLDDFAAAFDTLAEEAGRSTGEGPKRSPGTDPVGHQRTGTSVSPLPIGVLGQSLGALAFCDYHSAAAATGSGAAEDSDIEAIAAGHGAREALLLSPAIGLRPRVHILRPLIALHRRLPIPSASDPTDRLYDRLPAGAYRALFATYAAFRHSLRAAPLRLPCRIVVNEGDELVSTRGISRLIETGALSAAGLVVLARGAGARGAHHLAVDPDTMGGENWERFRGEVDRFVDAVATSKKTEDRV